MPVDEVLRGQDRRFIACLWLYVADDLRLNVEDTGFLVIDPNDQVPRHKMIFDKRSFGPALVGERTASDELSIVGRVRPWFVIVPQQAQPLAELQGH